VAGAGQNDAAGPRAGGLAAGGSNGPRERSHQLSFISTVILQVPACWRRFRGCWSAGL
jgi:hypothetical protein